MSFSPERVHEFSVLYDLYEGVLPPRQREVLELKLHEDLSLLEISEKLGISRQACEDALKRGERALLRLEAEIGFLERIRQEAARAKEISDRLKGMNQDNWRQVRDFCLEVLAPNTSGGGVEDGV